MKKFTRDTSVKITQWNHNCVKTSYVKHDENKWRKIEDRVNIEEHGRTDGAHCVVVVHKENLTMPGGHRYQAYCAMEDADNITTFSSKRRDRFDKDNFLHELCRSGHVEQAPW